MKLPELSFLKDFWAAVMVHALAVMFATAVTAIAAVLVRVQFPQLDRFAIPIAFVAGCIAGGIALVAIGRIRLVYPGIPRTEYEFKVLSHRIVYTLSNGGTITYRKLKTLQALKPGLTEYRDKYHWSGDKPPKSISCSSKDHTFTEASRSGVWRNYSIGFQRRLNKGDVIDTEVVWILDDSSHASSPFISATIEEPTRSLEFLLVFPVDYVVIGAECRVLTGMSAKKPLESSYHRAEVNGTIHWQPRPPHPRLMHHYEMVWTRPCDIPSHLHVHPST